jgi:hypothetical protein
MATNGLFVASHAFAGASTRCMLKKAMIRMLNEPQKPAIGPNRFLRR